MESHSKTISKALRAMRKLG